MQRNSESNSDIINKLKNLYKFKHTINERIINGSDLIEDLNEKRLDFDSINIEINTIAGEIVSMYKSSELPPLLITSGVNALHFSSFLQQMLTAANFNYEHDILQNNVIGNTKPGAICDTPIAGKNIIIVSAIYATGKKFAAIRDILLKAGAQQVSLAVLVEKQQKRSYKGPDNVFSCFTVSPNTLIFGFGISYNNFGSSYKKDINAINQKNLPTEKESEKLAQIEILQKNLILNNSEKELYNKTINNNSNASYGSLFSKQVNLVNSSSNIKDSFSDKKETNNNNDDTEPTATSFDDVTYTADSK